MIPPLMSLYSTRLRLLPLIIGLALSAPPLAQGAGIALPEIGDSAGNMLTPAEEQRLGQAFMRNLHRQVNLLDEPLWDGYLQGIGGRLVREGGLTGAGFRFFLVDDAAINAFAGPDGHIGINSGLVLTTESESELASVIAHEISHVTQHHLKRQMEAADQLSIPGAAMVLAAIVVGAAAKDPTLAQAAVAGVQAGLIQYQINFTRENEEEADRTGMQLLADSEYDPRAMPAFFDRMGKATRLYDNGKLPEFLRTHPVTSNRTADAANRAGAYPYKQRPEALEYHLLKAYLRERQFRDRAESLQFFRKGLDEGRYRNQAAQRYGYALALIHNGDFKGAEAQLDTLLQANPYQPAFVIAQADLLIKTGRGDQARTLVAAARKAAPADYPLALYQGEMLLNLGQSSSALKALEPLIRDHPRDTTLFRLLGRAAGAAGNAALGYQYRSEHLYLTGELESALQQLEIGLRDRNVSDFQSARMAARLKEIRQEMVDLRERKEPWAEDTRKNLTRF